MSAHVSVVIPTFNRAEMLCDCVDSVLASDYPSLDVIVVDDASTDGTEEACRARYGADARVRCLRNERNVLAAMSRNNGLAVARGEHVLFLDSDNLVAPDMIARLVAVLEADEALGLVGALSIQARNDTIWTLGADYNFFTSRPVNLHEGRRVAEVAPAGLYPTVYAPNAFMARRRVAERIGGFDVAYGMMYEEADFGYRIARAGFKAVICAEARTRHMGFVAQDDVAPLRWLGIESPLRTRCFARNRTRFMRRFAPWWNLIGYHLFFVHAFAAYYCFTALRNKRPDIARAYLSGTLAGLLGRRSACCAEF